MSPCCAVVRPYTDSVEVNGSSLLAALGVSPGRYGDYLNAASPTLASHVTVPVAGAGTLQSEGVPGVWVQLVEAREYARKLQLGDGMLLSNILREDLFQTVRILLSTTEFILMCCISLLH